MPKTNQTSGQGGTLRITSTALKALGHAGSSNLFKIQQQGGSNKFTYVFTRG